MRNPARPLTIELSSDNAVYSAAPNTVRRSAFQASPAPP